MVIKLFDSSLRIYLGEFAMIKKEKREASGIAIDYRPVGEGGKYVQFDLIKERAVVCEITIEERQIKSQKPLQN